MRIIDNLGIQAPANILTFSDDSGQTVSEFVDNGAFEVTAGIVCSSVACDNHLSGLLPTDVPEAPPGTVYTKRWFELIDDAATQRFLHLNEQDFSHYFESCTAEVAPAGGPNALLLGGYSWNGIALALIASRRGFTALGHLLVADLYLQAETNAVRHFIEGLGIEIVEIEARLSNGGSRGDMLGLVDAAASQKSAQYPVMLDPSSSTQKSADFFRSPGWDGAIVRCRFTTSFRSRVDQGNRTVRSAEYATRSRGRDCAHPNRCRCKAQARTLGRVHARFPGSGILLPPSVRL